jgi:hypothetical protein
VPPILCAPTSAGWNWAKWYSSTIGSGSDSTDVAESVTRSRLGTSNVIDAKRMSAERCTRKLMAQAGTLPSSHLANRPAGNAHAAGVSFDAGTSLVPCGRRTDRALQRARRTAATPAILDQHRKRSNRFHRAGGGSVCQKNVVLSLCERNFISRSEMTTLNYPTTSVPQLASVRGQPCRQGERTAYRVCLLQW